MIQRERVFSIFLSDRKILIERDTREKCGRLNLVIYAARRAQQRDTRGHEQRSLGRR